METENKPMKWILIRSKTDEYYNREAWERYGDFESSSTYTNALKECDDWMKPNYTDAEDFYNELVDFDFFAEHGIP